MKNGERELQTIIIMMIIVVMMMMLTNLDGDR